MLTPKAWRQEVFPGPRPVPWADIVTCRGAGPSTRAASASVASSASPTSAGPSLVTQSPPSPRWEAAVSAELGWSPDAGKAAHPGVLGPQPPSLPAEGRVDLLHLRGLHVVRSTMEHSR